LAANNIENEDNNNNNDDNNMSIMFGRASLNYTNARAILNEYIILEHY